MPICQKLKMGLDVCWWRNGGVPTNPDTIHFNEILLYVSAIRKMLHLHLNNLFLIPANNTPSIFLQKKTLNSARLKDYIWRKFKVLGSSAVTYHSNVTFYSGRLPSHSHLNPSFTPLLLDLVLFTICCCNFPITVSRVV